MSDLDTVRRLVAAAAATLEASRQRIDDLNVYPVPDGDTGTNMALTVRSVLEALEQSRATDREAIAREVTRAALMGARGNSGVILSQIVRGFADVLGRADPIDAPALARAFRAASDAAYRGVRRPVEGTMLTIVRELAEEAEAVARPDLPSAELLEALVVRGEDALARTPQMLDVLRRAGVVDAGGAGLVELVRGLASAVAGEPLPAPTPAAELGVEAIHLEPSRYRYCTTFVVEGEALDASRLERGLEPLGDSLLVVGDAAALRAHLHTDDPGAALSLAARMGALAGVEIADMHRQAAEREERLLRSLPEAEPALTEVVAVVAGAGNRLLYSSLGATHIVEGGQSMNPSTAEILAALGETRSPEVVLLPNNSNVIMSAEQAAGMAGKPVHVVPTRSLQAGLAAMVAFDPARPAAENAAAMEKAAAAVASGAVTRASRDLELNGRRVRKGEYLGLLEGEPVAGGADFERVAEEVVERLLSSPRELLTILTGEDPPPIDSLVRTVAERHPELELDVQAGGQPHYSLLLAAE